MSHNNFGSHLGAGQRDAFTDVEYSSSRRGGLLTGYAFDLGAFDRVAGGQLGGKQQTDILL